MKHITKKAEPQAFKKWKKTKNWRPTYKDLRGSVKKAVRDALMVEQGYICCYCERELTGDDSDSHIEHLKPQSSGVNPLDFSNMLRSCFGTSHRGKEPLHCGFKKDSWYGSIMVSPFDKNCEKRFKYLGDGRIKPEQVNDQGATETIHKLGLDIPKLNDLRRAAIGAITKVPHRQRRRFVKHYLAQKNGRFSGFWTTIKYLFP